MIPTASDILTYPFWRYLFRWLRGHVTNNQDAEDLASTVCVRLLASSTVIANPEQYAWRIARNLRTDYYREGMPTTELEEAIPLESADFRADVEITDMLQRAVQAAHLTPEQIEVLHLRYVDGYMPTEIASMVSKTPGAVTLLLIRGREKLRAALQGEAQP